MKTTNVTCPVCGRVNYNLYLDDTEGWMECDCCGNLSQHSVYMRKVRLPLIRMRDETKYMRIPEMAGGPI